MVQILSQFRAFLNDPETKSIIMIKNNFAEEEAADFIANSKIKNQL